jgi:hypothetical protein
LGPPPPPPPNTHTHTNTQDILGGLVSVATSSSNDNLRATALSSLARLLRSAPPLVATLLEAHGAELVTAGGGFGGVGWWVGRVGVVRNPQASRRGDYGRCSSSPMASGDEDMHMGRR